MLDLNYSKGVQKKREHDIRKRIEEANQNAQPRTPPQVPAILRKHLKVRCLTCGDPRIESPLSAGICGDSAGDC
jgi:hypothetical protein